VNQTRSALHTDPGKRRPHNEDFAAFFEPNDPQELQASGNIYIVADGVGGAEKGERASRYAVQKVLYEYYQYPDREPGERLRSSMRQAGNEIYQFVADSLNITRMATTMVAAVIRDQTLIVANVGDSRAYLLRNGNIEQITRDHSVVGEMVRNGLMSEEEASRSAVKNKITRSLGGETDVHVDVFKPIQLHQGDVVLLCSDGLTRYATAIDLIRISSQKSPEEAVQQLVEFANTAGGADNISVILVEIGQPLDADDPTLPVPRGSFPKPVDWDTIQTEPSLEPLQLQKKRARKQEYLLMAFAVLLLIVMTGVVFFTFNLLNAQPLNPPTETLTSSLMQASPQSLLTSEVPLVANNSPAVGEHNTATYPAPAASEFAPTEVLNIPPTEIPTLSFCVVQVQPNDFLSTILTQFDLHLEDGKQYYYFLSCSNDPPGCAEIRELPDINLIESDQWLLIDEVTQEECNNHPNGLWVSQTE